MNDLIFDEDGPASLFVPRIGLLESTIQRERLCLLMLNVFFLPGGGTGVGAIELNDYDIANE
jgi:hypothetical protein